MKWFQTFCWCSLIAVIFAGCAFESETAPVPTPTRPAAARPTEVFTPIALPTIATVPPPPTPTPAPSPTSVPTQAGATPVPVAAITTEMVAIPAGEATLGSNAGAADAKPEHKANIAAFTIDKFEATNDDFKKFVDATSYKTDSEKTNDPETWKNYADGKGKHPVVKVSWNDADAFCKWAGKRLPTEQEWEKAARGTDGRAFPWGNDYDAKKANMKDGGQRTTTVVGSFGAGASPYGVQDMAGNVWEWTASDPQVYPGGQRAGKLFTAGTKIMRGGGWFDTKDQIAVYARNSNVPGASNNDLGFRCAK